MNHSSAVFFLPSASKPPLSVHERYWRQALSELENVFDSIVPRRFNAIQINFLRSSAPALPVTVSGEARDNHCLRHCLKVLPVGLWCDDNCHAAE